MKPRLLVITTTYPRSTEDVGPDFVWQLCNRLASAFRVIVVTPHHPGISKIARIGKTIVVRTPYAPERWERLGYSNGLSDQLHGNRLLWLLVPMLLLRMIFTTAALLTGAKGVNCIHAHWVIPNLLVGIAARILARSSTPIACTAHGADLKTFGGSWANRLKRWALKRCDKIAAVSKPLAEVASHLAPNRKIQILPMGVDPGDEPHNAQMRSGLVFVGRLVEKKDPQTAIRALEKLNHDGSGRRLTVAGDGPQAAPLNQLISDLKLSDAVDSRGTVSRTEVTALLQRSMTAIFPFRTARNGDADGLGLVVLEAIAAGCPLVVSRTPVTLSFLTEGRHALMANPGDYEGFAACVRSIEADWPAALQRVKQAREEVLPLYSWDRVANEYQRWLLSAISDHRSTLKPASQT